jgi:hypothetical protein
MQRYRHGTERLSPQAYRHTAKGRVEGRSKAIFCRHFVARDYSEKQNWQRISPPSSVGSRTGAIPLRPVSSPRHVKRSVRISRTTLSCRLHPKGYGTYRTGSAFTAGSTVPRNPSTNQGSGISNPYSTCSSRSLCVFVLASDAAVSSSQPSPSHRQNTDWNAQPENS